MIDLGLPNELTGLVLDAQAGKTDEADALAACSLFVFRKLQRNPLLDEDVKQDFFLSFLPYIKNVIFRYRYQGIPFERYLAMIMKKRIKSFFRSQRRERLLWYISADESLAPAFQPDDPDPRPVPARLADLLERGPDGRLRTATMRKWFLVWALKHSRLLEAEDLAWTARLTGCSEDRVRELADGLAAGLRERDARLEKLRQRRNRLFVRARILEMRILREHDPDAKAALLGELAKKRQTLKNAVYEISRVAWHPSHSMVARALGLPKGTVDTIIIRVQRLLEARTVERETSIA